MGDHGPVAGSEHDHGVHVHAHDHTHDLGTSPDVARLLRLAIFAIVVVAVVGLVVWRPGGGVAIPDAIGGQGQRVNATVVGATEVQCAGTDFGGDPLICEQVLLEITSGANAGDSGSFEIYPQPGSPEFGEGDRIVVTEFDIGAGQVSYTFADYQRSRPLLLLTAIFVLAVVALGRFQGLRALAGLAVSGVVLLAFTFPALLDGQPPLAVALVSSIVIAMAALYLSHGVNDTTTVALLGTLGALGLTGLLAAVFTRAGQITGLASEDQIFLLVSAEGVDVRGLVLAGIVLGSLGVLDDVTVTQVSAVARLREANPSYSVGELYRSGVRIGRDHIASVVNTLVLAYAGAALPLLLFYSNIGIGFSESITSEVIAVEVIRTLVGSIGLVAAVPLTTGLAAVVVTGTGVSLPGLPSLTRRAKDDPASEPTRPEPDTATQEPVEGPAWDRFGPEEREF
jgi:uncharacterized membrane protein